MNTAPRLARFAGLLAGLLAGMMWAPLAAQAPSGASPAPSLDQVDSLIADGRTDAARTTLVAWLASKESRSRAAAQRALWQRALLTVDPAQAAIDYQRLVVEYPGGPYSDRALLRLAQAAREQGDPARARDLLASLLRDYPSSPTRLEAGALMETIANEPPRPVVAIEKPVEAAPQSDPVAPKPTVEQPAVEKPPAPKGVAQKPAAQKPAAQKPAAQTPAAEKPAAEKPSTEKPPPKPAGERPAAAKPTVPAGRWTVQLGAFASPDRAQGLQQDLAGAGVDARLVVVPGSRLIRVRTGRFDSQANADQERERLAGRGLPATVAGDADREETAR